MKEKPTRSGPSREKALRPAIRPVFSPVKGEFAESTASSSRQPPLIMKSRFFLVFPRMLTAGFALAFGALFSASANAQSPANDLTITVNELANGDVKFTASGTSQMLITGGFGTTNADSSTNTPPQNRPLNLPQYVQLPEGLVLTVPENPNSEEESAPEEGSLQNNQIPLNYLFFNSGYWHLGSFWSGTLQQGDSITGSGSITVSTSEVSFSDFVPGTYKVRRNPWGMNEELYDLTYKVIPYSVGISVSKPSRFPNTDVDRTNTQTITITNTGSTPVSGLKVQISRAGKKNFKVTQPNSSSLEAGASTTFVATFQPESAGTKSAKITITDGTSSKKVVLRGRGLAPRGNTNTPRFPRP